MPDNKEIDDISAPMPAAPFKYNNDGSVNWGDMWDSYCVLAQDGGPPHRGTMLNHNDQVNPDDEHYQMAVTEIIRGLAEVSGLRAFPHSPGWMGVECGSTTMAFWLAEAIMQENVETKHEDNILLVPVAEYYTLKGEIKNVITAVAKTTHYWGEHLPTEVKQTYAVQIQIGAWKEKVSGWLRRVFGKKD